LAEVIKTCFAKGYENFDIENTRQHSASIRTMH